MIAPSGEQIEIAHGDQRGGRRGGRRRPAGLLGRGPRAPRRIRRRRDEQLRARAGADPVAEPDPGRQLRVRRAPAPAPDRRRRGAGRDPRPRPLGGLDGRRARAGPGRDGARAPSAARLPVLARARHRVRALGRGPAGAATATNLGTSPCPYGAGAHPYLTVGTPTRRLADPARAGADGAAVRRARHPGRRRLRGGHGLRLSPAEGDRRDRLDNAFTDLERDDDGLARVELRDPDEERGLTLWVDESYPLPDALHRRPAARRRPAQPRGGAHDLPAERVPERAGPRSAWSPASRSRAPGASARRRARENLPAPW